MECSAWGGRQGGAEEVFMLNEAPNHEDVWEGQGILNLTTKCS